MKFKKALAKFINLPIMHITDEAVANSQPKLVVSQEDVFEFQKESENNFLTY